MLRFFRRIRQKLLTEGHLSKYLIYALGEILLVVAGILIALWLNNYTNERNNRIEEKALLEALKIELEDNHKNIQPILKTHISVVRLLKELIEHTGSNPTPPSDLRMDSLMYAVGLLPQFNPIENIARSINSSGQISIVRNEKIRSWLSSSSALLLEYQKSLEWSEKNYFEEIMPYIKDKFPFKRVIFMFPTDILISNNTTFSYSKKKLLSDIGFESLIANRLIDAQGIVTPAQSLSDQYLEILDLVESELKLIN